MPYSIDLMNTHQVDLPVSFEPLIMFNPSERKGAIFEVAKGGSHIRNYQDSQPPLLQEHPVRIAARSIISLSSLEALSSIFSLNSERKVPRSVSSLQ